jgi:hypothetical protein
VEVNGADEVPEEAVDPPAKRGLPEHREDVATPAACPRSSSHPGGLRFRFRPRRGLAGAGDRDGDPHQAEQPADPQLPGERLDALEPELHVHRHREQEEDEPEQARDDEHDAHRWRANFGDGAPRLEIWMSPEYSYLPLRIRVHAPKANGGRYATLNIDEIRVED